MNDHTVYTGGYVVLPNAAATDRRLSFRARGLLAYMLSRPPSWRFNADRLAAETEGEGREAVRTAMRELGRAGYYRCTRVQTHGGFRMVTEVAALPELLPLPESGFPVPGDLASGNLATGNPAPDVTTETHYGETSAGSAEVDQPADRAR